jgi:hypothetical protein
MLYLSFQFNKYYMKSFIFIYFRPQKHLKFINAIPFHIFVLFHEFR